MYVYVCVWRRPCWLHAGRACIHAYIHACMHAYTYIHIHTYMHGQHAASMDVAIHIHIHTFTYIHIHTHTHTYIYIHTHTYTYRQPTWTSPKHRATSPISISSSRSVHPPTPPAMDAYVHMRICACARSLPELAAVRRGLRSRRGGVTG